MKKAPVAITITTLYLVLFNLAAQFGTSLQVLIGMLCIAPFLLIYMTYLILKYGKPSPYTFDERFYDDWDYKRNGKEELDEE
jgi:amino acid transporter